MLESVQVKGQDFSEVIWGKFPGGEEMKTFQGCFHRAKGRAFQVVGDGMAWRQEEVEG